MTDSEYEEKFRAIAAGVKAKLDRASGCHDFDHTLRVLANALRIAEELPMADRRVVRMAALLHDVARPEEMAAKGRKCHAALGAELVVPLLREAGFDEAFTAHVSAAYRMIRERSLLLKFHSAIHYTPP